MAALAWMNACVKAEPFQGTTSDVSADVPADASADVQTDGAGDIAVCEPDCEDRTCGDDGCGGVCGTCTSIAPFCVEGQCTADCQPACDGKECGDDGCGGLCGTCPGAAPYCTDGLCETTCAPQCEDKECGPDGCDGVCGTCPDAAPVCSGDFKCLPAECTPDCEGRLCGDDGCGGSCGSCSGGSVCDTLAEGTGSYQCLLPVCTEDSATCGAGNAVTCNALGTGWFEADLCAQDQLACVESDETAFCGQDTDNILSTLGIQLADQAGPGAYLQAAVPELHGTTESQTNDPMSLSLWVRFPANVGSGTIASYETTGASVVLEEGSGECYYGDYGWAFYVEDDRLKFKTTDSENHAARIAVTRPIVSSYANTWVHLAVVNRGVEGDAAHANGNVQIYVNGADRWSRDELVVGGKQDSSGVYVGMSPNPKVSEPSLLIGRHRCEVPESDNPSGKLEIAIDEISTFGAALSHSQVTRLFAGGCGAAPTLLADEVPLYAWWRMGEGYASPGVLQSYLLQGPTDFQSASDTITESPADAILTGDNGSTIMEFGCAAPASCEDLPGPEGDTVLEGCGPGCAGCNQGECSSMGWCEAPACSSAGAEPLPGEGCSDACGSAMSTCDGQQTYCGYAGGVGSCHHDSANAVASYGDLGFVVVGTSCTDGTSGCHVALWRYLNDGTLVDHTTFQDLATQAYGFDSESNLEEEGLGVDVALDGSHRIILVGRTKTQYSAVDSAGNWRPMIASISGSDLSVEWVWVDKDHFGAFTDASLVPSEISDNTIISPPWSGAMAVGYLEHYYGVPDAGETAWKRGPIRRTILPQEGVPLPVDGSWSWPQSPANPGSPDIPVGGSYGGIDRAPDGSLYMVYSAESSDYPGLDARLERFGPSEPGCLNCWSAFSPFNSPTTSDEFVAVSAVGGTPWPSDLNRVFVAVQSVPNGAPGDTATRVRRYTDNPSGWGLELQESVSIASHNGGPANIKGLCAAGAEGFFLTGSMETPSGVMRPWVERRSAYGWPSEQQTPTWRQHYGYESLDGNQHPVPAGTLDVFHACAINPGMGAPTLVTVGEVLQPNALEANGPRDAYITARTLQTGKSVCR